MAKRIAQSEETRKRLQARCRQHTKSPDYVAHDLSGLLVPLEGPMRRTELLQGPRMLKLHDVMSRGEIAVTVH